MTPFWKSLAFWQSLSLVIAALAVYFFPDLKITAAIIEAVILAVLNLFNVQPELRARGLLK